MRLFSDWSNCITKKKIFRVLQLKHNEIEHQLEGPKVLAIASGIAEKIHSRNQRVLLSSLEVGVVILGCLVFLGALITAICVMCIRRKKRRYMLYINLIFKTTYRSNFRMLQKSFTQPLAYTIATSTLSKPSFFPGNFGDVMHYSEGGNLHPHDRNCPRTSSRRQPFRERSRSSGCMEKSITSLHSSGQDSGIADNATHCQCGQSSHSSEESSK